MAKKKNKDKITLSLRNKKRLQQAALTLGESSGALVDKVLDPFLDAIEEDIQKAASASSLHAQRAVETIKDYSQRNTRMVQGNSSVLESLEAFRKASQSEED